MPPETRALQNLLTQCRKDNRRFFGKTMAIKQGELRQRILASGSGLNFLQLCKGRIVPLSLQDTELTASNCGVLDRASARVLIAAFRKAKDSGDDGMYEEVRGFLLANRAPN